MPHNILNKKTRAQAALELAFSLPIILLLLIGMVEVVFVGRTYLALLDASVVGSRLGSKGTAFYDNSKIFTLTTQALTQEGYASSNLVDILIVRADLVGGATVNNYQVESMLSSGQPQTLTQQALLDKIDIGDPDTSVVGVEVLFDHQLLTGFSTFLPDPLLIRAYTLQIIP